MTLQEWEHVPFLHSSRGKDKLNASVRPNEAYSHSQRKHIQGI